MFGPGLFPQYAAGYVVYLSDRRDRDSLKDKASIVARGIRALVSFPLVDESRLLGILYLGLAAGSYVMIKRV